MRDKEIARMVAAIYVHNTLLEEEERLARRRREIRASLGKLPSGTPVTPEIAALFDELESLIAQGKLLREENDAA